MENIVSPISHTPLTNQTNPTSSPSSHGGKRSGAGRPSSVERDKRKKEQAEALQQARVREAEWRQNMQNVRSSLTNRRGRSLTAAENRILLALLLALQLDMKMTLTEAQQNVGQWVGSSRHTVRAVWEYFLQHSTIKPPSIAVRGAAVLSHPWRNSQLQIEQIATLQVALLKHHQKGKHCSSSLLLKELKREHQLNVSARTVRRWLHKLGYQWKTSRNIGMQTKEERARRMRAFLKEYAAALQLQSAGTHVLVYTDESYCHTGHHSQFGWFRETTEVRRKCGRGQRFILLHALTMDGLLAKKNSRGEVVTVSETVTEAAFNAELVFTGLNVDEDYHKSVDADVFISWVENRLIPAFKAIYKNKKMILVLDNAPYHHAHSADWKNPNQMSKLEIAAWLVDKGFTKIDITRENTKHTFGLASLFAPRSGKYAPSLDEMKKVMKAYLIQHPEMSRTRLQEIFHQHQYELVFTPPYTPQVQPIELVWAHVKNYVARQSDSSTNGEKLREMIRKGFYGDPSNEHEPVNGPLSHRLLNHCHQWMNTFIDGDEDLSGNIMNLIVDGEPQVDQFDDEEEQQEEDESSTSEEQEDYDKEEDDKAE